MYADAYAVLIDTRNVGIGKASYVVNLEYLEDVFDAERELHIGHVGKWIFILVVQGEEIKIVIVCESGIVARTQAAIEALEVDDFTPAESLDEWQAVENESVHIIGCFP